MSSPLAMETALASGTCGGSRRRRERARWTRRALWLRTRWEHLVAVDDGAEVPVPPQQEEMVHVRAAEALEDQMDAGKQELSMYQEKLIEEKIAERVQMKGPLSIGDVEKLVHCKLGEFQADFMKSLGPALQSRLDEESVKNAKKLDWLLDQFDALGSTMKQQYQGMESRLAICMEKHDLAGGLPKQENEDVLERLMVLERKARQYDTDDRDWANLVFELEKRVNEMDEAVDERLVSLERRDQEVPEVAAEQQEEEQDSLLRWRACLRPGMPVHVANLKGVAGELWNGHAGLLASYSAVRSKWKLQMGSEVCPDAEFHEFWLADSFLVP